MKPLMDTCDACAGRGVVPHERRDNWDQQDEELCSKCGGSGQMVATPPEEEVPVRLGLFRKEWMRITGDTYGEKGMC